MVEHGRTVSGTLLQIVIGKETDGKGQDSQRWDAKGCWKGFVLNHGRGHFDFVQKRLQLTTGPAQTCCHRRWALDLLDARAACFFAPD